MNAVSLDIHQHMQYIFITVTQNKLYFKYNAIYILWHVAEMLTTPPLKSRTVRGEGKAANSLQ